MAGADPADYAIRLNAWLTGRRANVHPKISTTQVRAVPLDRASSAYTIAESDVASAVARATELEAENARLQRELAAALDGNQRLQTMNEGLRQMAIQAREAANGWHQATIDLYSGREEAAPQQPAQTPAGPQCESHAHPDFVEDPTIRCELPDGHAWHRNGERTWTP